MSFPEVTHDAESDDNGKQLYATPRNLAPDVHVR
jgi:hypothetical protein